MIKEQRFLAFNEKTGFYLVFSGLRKNRVKPAFLPGFLCLVRGTL
jgi:hypothetical protein